jgi:hypothetical protein
MASMASSPSKPASTNSPFAWIIPLLLFCVVLAGLGLYYKYEQQLNQDVIMLHSRAKTEALEGRYGSAAALLDSAAAKRPNYQALLQDRAVTAEAANWQVQLREAAEGLKEQQLQSSETTINTIAGELENRQEPLFAALRQELAAAQLELEDLKNKSEQD